ncbi:hypothetical protein JAAARDRAFT_201204 [Jaapia argillacea MUCL 33604]|uniref:Uncharacterized protein n=1 Tax=Jaapia argillacea MUCL 33604 TaxID=933084 RepID=A0A067P5B9_9AGAM|nr:hypothetical protein JAAARDRAFT_201204 [Jaapia argillacea MUCL 33604]
MGSSSITIIFLLNTRDGYISLQTSLQYILVPAHPTSSALSFIFVTLTPRHFITPPSNHRLWTMDYRPLTTDSYSF